MISDIFPEASLAPIFESGGSRLMISASTILSSTRQAGHGNAAGTATQTTTTHVSTSIRHRMHQHQERTIPIQTIGETFLPPYSPVWTND